VQKAAYRSTGDKVAEEWLQLRPGAKLQNGKGSEAGGDDESQQGSTTIESKHTEESEQEESQRDARIPECVKPRFRHAFTKGIPPLVPAAINVTEWIKNTQSFRCSVVS
jgi:hypothetical protein